MTAFHQFKKTLLANYDAACSSYRTEEVPPLNINENIVPQWKSIIGNDNLAAFEILKQGCLFEYINVLLTKRESKGNAVKTTAFTALQGKMSQFLANIDVHNPVALLQAQMDMIAYENTVRVHQAK